MFQSLRISDTKSKEEFHLSQPSQHNHGQFTLPAPYLTKLLLSMETSYYNRRTLKAFLKTHGIIIKGPKPRWFSCIEINHTFSDYNRRLYIPLCYPHINYLRSGYRQINGLKRYYRTKNDNETTSRNKSLLVKRQITLQKLEILGRCH